MYLRIFILLMSNCLVPVEAFMLAALLTMRLWKMFLQRIAITETQAQVK